MPHPTASCQNNENISGAGVKDIEKDFGSFLDKQKQLKKNKRNTNKYGISEDEIDSAWRRFVKGSTDVN